MVNFGAGQPLKEASPWLRDDAERHARILDVTERNSVIEGLPPFRDELRKRLQDVLATMTPSEPQRAPAESPRSSE